MMSILMKGRLAERSAELSRKRQVLKKQQKLAADLQALREETDRNAHVVAAQRQAARFDDELGKVSVAMRRLETEIDALVSEVADLTTMQG